MPKRLPSTNYDNMLHPDGKQLLDDNSNDNSIDLSDEDFEEEELRILNENVCKK